MFLFLQDSGINMEATAEIHNEGKTEKGQNGQNGQADQTDGEKGLSEAEKVRGINEWMNVWINYFFAALEL